MNKYSPSPTTPFKDSYAIDFMLPKFGELNWRQRTIAGVSLNAQDEEAYFFNPDGLALPLKLEPLGLPDLLRSKVRRPKAFGTIEGTGVFAMKPAQINAMPASVKSLWVTYWFIDGTEKYTTDKGAWADYVDKEVQQLLRSHVPQMTDTQDLYWPEYLRHKNATEQDLETLTERRQAYVEQSRMEAEKDYRAELAIQYAKECATDQQINAWLRGVLGHPPLLAAMQGAA